MENKKKKKLQFLSCILLQFSSFSLLSLAFTPLDNYLIDCGSNATTTIDNRNFLGDLTKSGSEFLSDSRTISVRDKNPSPGSSPLYHTARVFTRDFSYEFQIKKQNTHLVLRLLFFPFSSQNYNLNSALFHVSVNGFSLLRNFSIHNNNNNTAALKEYILLANAGNLEILFTPAGRSDFGFVNAIEVFSVPTNFIVDEETRLIGSKGIGEYKDLASQTLETVHRINVGGSKITPFNDTLWRTWIPDESFLTLKSAAKNVSRASPPNYQPGGATREIAPDHVYMTAQEMNKDPSSTVANFNITWVFPVSSGGGITHLVRMHFCDIVSLSLDLLYFNIYINGYIAYEDFDLSSLTVRSLAAPYYIDSVCDSDNSGFIRISVGPSSISSPHRINAILNGVEIMKVLNGAGGGKISQGWSKKKKVAVLVGSVLGGLAFICVAVLAVLWVLKCRKKKPNPKPAQTVSWSPLPVYGGSSYSKVSEGTTSASPGPNVHLSLKISFADIQFATKNFDKNLVIGSGGFGMVYKGELRDGTKIAVKRGVPGSRQGLPEFHTEITVLSKIRHRHLVSLVGYCEEQSEMILVYEFIEKGPLKNHLYGSGLPPLSWKQRLDICIGSARGLHYLHTGSAQGIIHRDVKSTNILLDENYSAKVADFGLSRSGPCLDETHVSTGVKGSFGYLDPEYFKLQQLTDKSDVYSFGVVLLEILCARPAIDPLLTREQVNLAEWAMRWQKKGLLEQIIDPQLAGKINPNSLRKFGETAEKCLAEYGVDRPTMGDVLWNLEYALQLQETGVRREPHEDSIASETELPVPATVPRVQSSNIRIQGDSDASSDITKSQVFSQLMTNEGR